MAYSHHFVDPRHARSRRSRSAGAVFPRPATADGGVPLSLRDRTFNFRTGGGDARDFRHFKGYPHPGGIPTNCIGDNWSLTPSPSLTARKVLSILESPRIYEELYGSFHPLVYQRDTLLHASSQGLFWPRQAPHRPHMGSGSRSGVVPMQDYYYDTPYYPQAYAYEEAPSTSYPQNAYLPPSRDISGYPAHHLSNPYLNSASSAAPYSYGYGGTAGGGGRHTTYYPSRPPPRRSKSSLGFYHEPSGMSTMTGDERLWAANDPVEPSSMKYRPSFHSLPRNAGRNQQHRRRLGQQQQFWPDGTINATAAAGGVGGGLEPNVAGLGLDGNGYQYNSDPRRSTGPSYHYQQTGTHWDREYANFRSSMPENLNQTRNSYFQQNYPPSYYPNPFYHSDLEHHPYSSYLAQGTTNHHSTADPYGTMGRRYRDYSNPHHHHQQQQQHLVGNPDDPAYYGG
ncbi:uncharacterized protein LOC131881809 [Tigriopus californicus]|uniref:uncharacterized protein LOC131881809 n=1 Tax=Tigriopus californicus TaxID=6832 RepID=UPI0027DAA315|nr:uncharacterized protein LOC131881809 [Tigriopus californicus]